MTTRTDRWEHGSDFHTLLAPIELPPAPTPWWPAGAELFGSGRDAMRFVLRVGRERHGWSRLFVPDYFCQEVIAALATERLLVETYRCNPWSDVVLGGDFGRHDVLLTLPYFGQRPPPSVAPRPMRPFWVIEDHTHDPTSVWATTSHADYCVASLRKTLPIPEGGIAWSGAGPLPAAPPCTPDRERAASAKREAMWLKAAYLAGAGVDKPAFRELALEGEASIASGDVSGMTRATRQLLPLLPIAEWRAVRRANHQRLNEALRDLSWLTPLDAHPDGYPSAFVARVDTHERRERVRSRLISNRVYPAVLWPLDEPVVAVSPIAREISKTILVLHCDARYDATDLQRVASLVAAAGNESLERESTER